jgi:hypothetical protein
MNSSILATGNARQANTDTGYFISGVLDAITKKPTTPTAGTASGSTGGGNNSAASQTGFI